MKARKAKQARFISRREANKERNRQESNFNSNNNLKSKSDCEIFPSSTDTETKEQNQPTRGINLSLIQQCSHDIIPSNHPSIKYPPSTQTPYRSLQNDRKIP